ncbi:MAG: HesB/IscA family protein [Gammaproteobacteria bacterium]
MAISLTEAAAKRINRILANDATGGIALRVGLKKVGCSGMAYTYDVAHEIKDGDQVFEQDGAKLVVDSSTFVYLIGSQLDYVREGLKESFKFQNPNEKAACGCGESVSFTIPDRATTP